MQNFYERIDGTTTLTIQERNGSLVNHGVVLTSKMFETLRDETSHNTPGFQTLKRYQLPQNPYTKVTARQEYPKSSPIYKEQYLDGTSRLWFYSGPGTAFYLDISESNVEYPSDPTLYNKAVQRLQAQSTQSSGSLSVTMAEAHKTASHIAQTATRFANAFRSLRRGRLGDFANAVGVTAPVRKVRAYRNRALQEERLGSSRARDFAASTWLEYTYAWKPLLQDVHTQAENLARVLADNDYTLRSARGKATGQVVHTRKFTEPSGVWSYTKEVVVDARESLTVRYRIPNGAASVANTFGLLNPLEVAWEVIPFSFVADWFLPVGDFISGLSAFNGLEFAGGSRASVRVSTHVCKGAKGPGNAGTNPKGFLTTPAGTATGQYLSKTRTLLSGFPHQELPRFKNPSSFAHATSAMALIQSVFGGSRSGKTGFRG
jgi:hypothetical protein